MRKSHGTIGVSINMGTPYSWMVYFMENPKPYPYLHIWHIVSPAKHGWLLGGYASLCHTWCIFGEILMAQSWGHDMGFSPAANVRQQAIALWIGNIYIYIWNVKVYIYMKCIYIYTSHIHIWYIYMHHIYMIYIYIWCIYICIYLWYIYKMYIYIYIIYIISYTYISYIYMYIIYISYIYKWYTRNI